MLRVFALVLLLAGLTLSASLSAESAPRAARGKKYALLIGVTEYKHSAFASLKYTENDVEKLAELLLDKSAGFTDVRVLSSSRGKKNAKDTPTAANVGKALADLVADKTQGRRRPRRRGGSRRAPGGGRPRRQGQAEELELFLPSDADLVGVSYSTGKSKSLVNLEDLFTQLGQCGAGTKLALIDACRNDLKAGATRNLDPDMSAPRGVAALLSCGPGQRAWETEKLGEGHGVFFHYVLEGMKGKARNLQGEVTWLPAGRVRAAAGVAAGAEAGRPGGQTDAAQFDEPGRRVAGAAEGAEAGDLGHDHDDREKTTDDSEAIRKGLAQVETVSRTKPRSAREGFRKALSHLEGKFFRHDPAEAAKLFRQSAEGGCELSRARCWRSPSRQRRQARRRRGAPGWAGSASPR